MKIFNVKTAIAAVCVVAAGFGGVKAYDVANQSETDMLLAENVEALSQGGYTEYDAQTDCIKKACPITDPSAYCYWYCPNEGRAEGVKPNK